MRITYGYRWFWARNRLTEVWDKSKTRIAHSNNKQHTVVVDANEEERVIIEIEGTAIRVTFLDSRNRNHLMHYFEMRRTMTLFLSQAIARKFVDDSSQSFYQKVYKYSDNGCVDVREINYDSGEQHFYQTCLEISSHWIPYPEFGEYVELVNLRTVSG